jgi:NAD(P)-dependent dehydrogenase (short-subunit alcohol dehydrogenase family)
MLPFTNRVVVLTGVGRPGQVGEVVAGAFAAQGASLALIGRSPDELDAHLTTLKARGSDARAYLADLSDPSQVGAVATQIAGDFGGRADALVNMAGGFAMSGPVAHSDVAQFQKQIAINLTTAYLATRACIPLLRPARGAIVYFSSGSALPAGRAAEMSAYVIAKTGVLALMRAVAQEELPNGVRSNALALNAVRTAANLASLGDKTRYVEREDVASSVLFLCSDEAKAVTGQVIQLG